MIPSLGMIATITNSLNINAMITVVTHDGLATAFTIEDPNILDQIKTIVHDALVKKLAMKG
jgi:hypothetical protein